MMEERRTDLIIKKLKDGRNYTIRLDRHRFFFPDEWKKFVNALKEKKRPLFEFIFNTGARFDEAAHIRPCDVDFEKCNVRLWKTKTKVKKGESYGKPRVVSISTQYARKLKKWANNFQNEDYMFKCSIQAANQLLKRTLKKIGIKDWYNFSTHNIRKTHGMYLKALGIDIAEICTRLGHDYNTYISHYGSADVFSDSDMRKIKELLGDLYMRSRKF